MLLRFFLHLRDHRIPVSIREHLDLIAALKARVVFANMDHFYFLSRLCLVKDEKYFDRFDIAFGSFFSNLESWEGIFNLQLSADLLEPLLLKVAPEFREKVLRDEWREALTEYKSVIDGMDLHQKGLETRPVPTSKEREKQVPSGEISAFRERNHPAPYDVIKPGAQDDPESDSVEKGDNGDQWDQWDQWDQGDQGDQGKGHEGKDGEGRNGERGEGSSDIPAAGVKTNLESKSQRMAVKVWVDRQFKDYDPDVELGTRNIKIALRRLRKFARVSAALELDLDDTIRSTARNGGILDIKEVPERHNAVKVLLFLDVGGSMDDHIELCGQLFSAARSEFKHLETFYFHNFLYEAVWTSNVWASSDRREEDRVLLSDILRKYGRDYKVIFVGDAQMARHEIMETGGSVEHYNSKSGDKWMAELLEQFRRVAWLNPVPTENWRDTDSTEIIRRLLDDKMYHLGIQGIDAAMKYLVH